MACLALPQRDFQTASGADRGSAVYGVSRLPDLMAAIHPAGRDRAPWGMNVSSPVSSVGVISDARNHAFLALNYTGRYPSGPHSPSILSLLCQLLI